TVDTELGVLIGEHDRHGADPGLRVADTAARLGQPEQLLRAESAGVKVERRSGVMHTQVGEDIVDLERFWRAHRYASNVIPQAMLARGGRAVLKVSYPTTWWNGLVRLGGRYAVGGTPQKARNSRARWA